MGWHSDGKVSCFCQICSGDVNYNVFIYTCRVIQCIVESKLSADNFLHFAFIFMCTLSFLLVFRHVSFTSTVLNLIHKLGHVSFTLSLFNVMSQSLPF